MAADGAVRHLGFVLSEFWIVPDVPLDGQNFPC